MSTKLKNPYILLLLFSSATLLFVYFVEYAMQIAVCPLCIYQRYTYLVFIMLSIISLSSKKNYITYYIITAICAIFLAAYHTGIERGIFELSSFCMAAVSIADNIPDSSFTKMLYADPIALCNKPALVIFRLSMTEWNLLANIAILLGLIKFRNYKGAI